MGDVGAGGVESGRRVHRDRQRRRDRAHLGGAHGHLLAVLDHQGEWVLSAAFSPDGRRVVTGRGDGVATVWELPRFSGGPRELGRIVRCRVPYAAADEDSIVARARRDLEACRQTGDAR